MVPFCCLLPPSPATISKLISDQTYLSMLDKNCTTMKDLKKIHSQLIKTGLAKDTNAASRILAFCASPAGDINYAYLVFVQIQNPNIFAWNTIIRGFSRSSVPQNSISLYIDMLLTSPVQPQRLTYPSVFKAFAQLDLASEGAQLHGKMIKLGLENDSFIRNTILFMYVNCGFTSEARKVFDRGMDFDIVAWNTMIMGVAKCGLVDESRRLFDKMSLRNAVSWNSMISGYVRNGRFFDALELFQKMQVERIEPSEFTMVSLLNACACLGAIRQGEWIHDYMVKKKFELNPIVVTAIIDMYSKCGSIDKAVQVFQSAPRRGLSCWNSMILGLAMNGQENEALQLFSVLQSSDLRPDDVSFIAVLTACDHTGMVDKAKDYFLLMRDKYKIKPGIKHFSCMVDVLGRAGLLEEAEELIRSMHVDPDAIIWGSLLWSCCKYGNIKMAKRAANHLIELNPSESSSFVLVANAYAAANNFEEALKERLTLKENHIGKEPGCSCIEVGGEVHEFVAGGRAHPEIKEIYRVLDVLTLTNKRN
ncbi:pentatricopeptide repeat-containing protein At2g42920, chloroplastic [Ricinus communis]|uniref:Pentatricopeptide repeat-containing protein, putative n=1 Tax=Ricinus communis TaxID=3988 RepID=B9T751_RICCO|nr:pentatricopeptide repeat-containing protein At2g42920, chloroplastic [Ricinus communis]EEF28314.1 pentatricopeptide repeat-containing protein, putative [Ricinus communis]|eukprot:XP_002534070.1 pentatricopeptide repeat-containing protein At2g42920, chloroplastic [Ricinus communis]